MIREVNANITGRHEARIDIQYNDAHRSFEGHSSLRIITKGDGRIDGIFITEYDKDGNVVVSEAWWY